MLHTTYYILHTTYYILYTMYYIPFYTIPYYKDKLHQEFYNVPTKAEKSCMYVCMRVCV